MFCYTDIDLENILLSKELFQKWTQKQSDGGYQYLIETDNDDAKDEFVKTIDEFKETILKLTVAIHNCSEQLRRNRCDRACGSGDSV